MFVFLLFKLIRTVCIDCFDFVQVLEKKKAVDRAIKAASVVKDHLVFYTPFRQFNRNGMELGGGLECLFLFSL